MKNEYELLLESFNNIKKDVPFEPEIAIVLGSGLSGFCDDKKVINRIKYIDIENFPKPTVDGHSGEYIFTEINGKKVVCLSGRAHYYEGYDVVEAVRPVRMLKFFGVKNLLLTNAAGAVNAEYKVGDFVLIKDHISFFVPNPLRGKNIDEFGTRFPDMSKTYDEDLRNIIKNIGKENNITVREGIYSQVSGPTYETPTEIKMLRALGADVTGMSTVIEAIAMHHIGIKLCAISLVTNMAAGILDKPLSHEEVKEAADMATVKFKILVEEFIKRI